MSLYQSIFPCAAFLTAFLILIPLPLHGRTRNVAAVAIIVWLFAVNIVSGVNAIIGIADFNLSVAIWCDVCKRLLIFPFCVATLSHYWIVATKVAIGSSVAIPAATMCISMHLAVLWPRHDVQSKRRQQIIFESIMCFGVPILIMGLRAHFRSIHI